MKHTFFPTLLLTTVLAVASCTTTKSAYSLAGEWDVTMINGTRVKPVADVTPFLGFDLNEGHVYGFTGCNRLTGSIDAKALANGKADFSRMGSTRMLCHDDSYERPFLDALGKACRSTLAGDSLQLMDKSGNVLVTLHKR